jgi:hypothetical protein
MTAVRSLTCGEQLPDLTSLCNISRIELGFSSAGVPPAR